MHIQKSGHRGRGSSAVPALAVAASLALATPAAIAANAQHAQSSKMPESGAQRPAHDKPLPQIAGTRKSGNYHAGFDLARMPVGRIDERIVPGKNVIEMHGALTQQVYVLPDDISRYRAYVTYRRMLRDAGFKILFTCRGAKQCGAGFGPYVNGGGPVVKPQVKYTAYTPYAAIAANKSTNHGQRYVFIYTGQYDRHRLFEQRVVTQEHNSS